jgi:hypothetical protein
MSDSKDRNNARERDRKKRKRGGKKRRKKEMWNETFMALNLRTVFILREGPTLREIN